MTTKEVTAIVLRLFSLWLLVQVILSAPAVVLFLTTMEQYQQQTIPGYMYLAMTVSFIVIGLIAVCLLWRTARSVLAKSGEESTVVGQQSQKFLLQAGGIYFIVNSLAYLPGSFGFLQSAADASYMHLLSPLGLLLQLFIGLTLVIHSSWWVYLFAKLRGRR